MSMTVVIARPPLQLLSMSSTQSGSRRHSARLQQKEDSVSQSGGAVNGTTKATRTKEAAKSQSSDISSSKKRKNAYDEDDDGFKFARVQKKKKPKPSEAEAGAPPAATAATTMAAAVAVAPPPTKSATRTTQTPSTSKVTRQRSKDATHSRQASPQAQDAQQEIDVPKKRRKKMSFSTPVAKEQTQATRRSKRISDGAIEGNNTTRPATTPSRRQQPAEQTKALQKIAETRPIERKVVEKKNLERTPIAKKHVEPVPVEHEPKAVEEKAPEQIGPENTAEVPTSDPSEGAHSATRIALPFADTPVISRNKAMREGKKGKGGERRSSLGLRGRRASSLIDTGASNALPHSEVEVVDFYKHIESGLLEPRRMRQLLTWCATRAMHPKPQGTDFEDASAKSAVRVIEEELLKELANKSELSDWFSREDTPKPIVPLPERPNPKNVQNTKKISELEERIQRLKLEKEALETITRPPLMPSASSIPNIITQNPPNSPKPPDSVSDSLDRSLLSESDAAILTSLRSSHSASDPSSSAFPSLKPTSVDEMTARLNMITSRLGSTIDTFADSVHQIAQYRGAVDNTASRVLAVCADKLAQREREERRRVIEKLNPRAVNVGGGAERTQDSGSDTGMGGGTGPSPGRDLSSVLRGLSRADR